MDVLSCSRRGRLEVEPGHCWRVVNIWAFPLKRILENKMKPFIISLIMVLTLGIVPAVADCGWVVWQIVNKDKKNFWRVQDGVKTYDECRVSAESMVASFYERAKRNEANVHVMKNEWTITVAKASTKGESTQLEATNVEYLCLPTSMDPRT